MDSEAVTVATQSLKRHRLQGGCHCANIAVLFRPFVAPHELPLRSCQCTFCRRHGARTTSDPSGAAVFVVREPALLSRYQFGHATAEFVVCARCGTYTGALMHGAAGSFAVINTNALVDAEGAFDRSAEPVDYDAEAATERFSRRVARWMPATVLVRQRARVDAPEAAPLVAAYFDELARALGEFDPRRSISAEPEDMLPPAGTFLILLDGERPIACGGLKTHVPGVGEIKRMFVVPEARGRHLGLALLNELECEARVLGMNRLVLDTAAPLAAAAALYESAGYGEVEPFNDNPYAARWFAKELT
jgi:GNAT superfamily N-acetyltransferase